MVWASLIGWLAFDYGLKKGEKGIDHEFVLFPGVELAPFFSLNPPLLTFF
jgi:hypothetical protein